MSSLAKVIVLSSILGVASFGFGLLPLAYPFSRKNLARLSIFGTGLLLGASVGVIIPEGIETVYAAHQTKNEVSHTDPPTLKIALSLLSGFCLMLVMESLASPSHGSSPHSYRSNAVPLSYHRRESTTSSHHLPLSRPLSPTTAPSIQDGDFDLDIDAEIAGLEDGKLPWLSSREENAAAPQLKDPNLVTLGLIIHSLADGLALGASLAAASSGEVGEDDSPFSGLSLVVFMALALHKAPAALALTSTLITAHLSTRTVRTHLAAFSLAAPISAILTFLALRWFGSTSGSGASDDWTGLALLFSGGTFLYVATLLSPLSNHVHSPGEASNAEADLGTWMRLALIGAGMYTPVLIGGLVGHGHAE